MDILQKRRESIQSGERMFKAFDFEAKAKQPDGSVFEGLVSAFYNIDSYGEIVDDAAFDEDLPEFMRTGFIGGLNHDWDNPIGSPQPGTMVTPKGLHLVGSVIDTSHGMDVRKMLVAGVVKKLSIGYRTLGYKVLETVDDVLAYWESKKYMPTAQDLARAAMGNVWVLTRLKLYEGSPVTVPANDAADITAVKARAAKAVAECFGDSCACRKTDYSAPDTSASDSHPDDTPQTVREFERFLRDAGLSRTKAAEAVALAKTLPRDAASGDAGTTPKPPAETPADPPAPASETPAEKAPEQKAVDAEETAPTTVTPEETKPAYRLPDDVLPETAKQAQRVAVLLHKQFLEIQSRSVRL